MKNDKLQQILDQFPTNVVIEHVRETREENDPHWEKPPKEATIVFSFSEKGFGFGEIAIKQIGQEVFIDTEKMNLNKVKQYLNSFLDKAILDVDKDPVKHKRYNEIMKRSCGEGCKVCYNDGDKQNE